MAEPHAAAVGAAGRIPSQQSEPYAEPYTESRDADEPAQGPPEAAAFGPAHFRTAAERTLGQLARHIGDHSVRGLELTDPRVLAKTARSLMTRERERVAGFDGDRLAAIVDLYLETGIQVHSPGAMGRQFTGSVPLAAVVEFAGSVANQPSSFYEAAQLPKVAEQIMAAELNAYIGWDPGRFCMTTTSGGSLANLTALLAARNRAFPGFWADGAAAFGGRGARPAIAIGADAHYSVARAAGVIGVGESQIVRLPLNAAKQIDPDAARSTLDAAKARGLDVFCLVASAGTTALGAFDPLDELGDLAREMGLWLHVDGAHGASLLLSGRLRHRLRGIEKADSLTWDAHKMMFVPAPCTLLFHRDKDAGAGAFRQRASYVFDDEPDLYTALDSGDRNLECTKRPMIMPLWVLWAVYGPALFAERIEQLCRLTERAYQLVRAAPDFEALHHPEANILCFRHRPPGLPEHHVHRHQIAIRDRIKARGDFFISKVDVDGTAALRVVLMNHRTTADHFRTLLAEIRTAGQGVERAC
ncbi:pyridoxal-dependent decarboxylase [Streptomyces sp. NPDC088194]|uniref:pyridoxal phosphate-dependent decarboxylase family protein n=1 Tax=Streptomyces sp. NPDC088194 TaxID=3154931 RepID=UPI00344F9A3A